MLERNATKVSRRYFEKTNTYDLYVSFHFESFDTHDISSNARGEGGSISV